MKKSDIAMILLIAAASSLIAYFVASSFISGSQGYTQKVKTIDSIDSSIIEPSTDVFNKDAINPAVPVPIGSDAATQ